MGTAPRRPTHEMYSRPLNVKLRNGSSDMNVAMGRAASIMNKASSNPGMITCGVTSSWGLTNSPSERNIIICISHVNPPKNVVIVPLSARRLLPTTSPLRYTAR